MFYFGPKFCYSSDINWAKPISPASMCSPQVDDGPTCHTPPHSKKKNCHTPIQTA